MLTENPSRIAQVDDKVGTLHPGKLGDIILFDITEEGRLQLTAVFIGGLLSWERRGTT